LIIFSILLTSHISQKFESSGWKKDLFSAIAAATGAILSIITILDYKFSATTEAAKEVNMRLIGKSLLSVDYDGYVLPFEVISVLLLAAMVAAIVVAKKGSPKTIGLSKLNQE
jgi:NADH-quinone oxidoreductase subunit J